MHKRDDLLLLIAELRPNVIALCETWLSDLDPFTIPGFRIARRDRLTRGGGVLLAFANDLVVENEQLNSPLEIVCCRVRLSDQCSIAIASIYLPPVPFIAQYVDLKNTFDQIPNPKLVLGDFNSHGTEWGCLHNDSRSHVLRAVLDDTQTVTLNTGEPTRFAAPPSRNSAVDLSICSSSAALWCEWQATDNPCGSDHVPVVIHFNKRPQERPPTLANRPLAKRICWERYRTSISERLINSADEETTYDDLMAVVYGSAITAQTTPLPNVANSQRNGTNNKVWWNDELRAKYESKRLAFQEFRARGGRTEFLAHKNAEAVFRRAKRASKRASWRDYCSSLNSSTSLSSLYAMAKRYRGVSTNTRSTISTDDWLHDFSAKLAPPSAPTAACSVPDYCPNSAMNAPFDPSELDAALTTSKNTAAGLDQIPFALLRELPEVAKQTLLVLFNTFLSSCQFPDSWYECKVVAILKPGKDPNLHSSYRPICLLSCTRKLFEKMVLSRIDFWAEKQMRVATSQYGFRKGYGTQECLAILSTDLELCFARKGIALCVFMDVSAAYDDVLIDVMRDTLRKLGLDPHITAVLSQLFHKRVLHFYHNNVHRLSRTGYKGLAQGSSLSPLLFNLYTAAIETRAPRTAKVLQYADDVAVYMMGDRREGTAMEREMQCLLHRLSRSYSDLGLSISKTKTEYMLFSRLYINPSVRLFLDNAPIKSVQEFKYLGVIFDKKLSWKNQTDALVAKCGKRINFLKSVAGSTWGAHPDCLLTLFKATVRSALDYGAHCYQFMARTHRLKLFRLQWRALRICLGLMNSTHTQTCEVLAGIPPLDIRWRELTSRLIIKAMAAPNDRLRHSFEKLVETCPNHPLAVLSADLITLPIESVASFPCYNTSSLLGTLFAPKVCWRMRDEMKARPQMQPAEIQDIFNVWASENVTATFVYTDGSKTDNGTGSAAYLSSEICAQSRLLEPSNVFSAELNAIREACTLIANLGEGQFIVASDSMASVQALLNQRLSARRPHLLYLVKDLMRQLKLSNRVVSLAWVPAHCGIPGNEASDIAAKRATRSGVVADIPPEWLHYVASADACITTWQNRWASGDLGRFCHSIVPKVCRKPWHSTFDEPLTRHEIRTACRIASNHTRLGVHLKRINVIESDLCTYCHLNQYESVDHILFECQCNVEGREELVQTLEENRLMPPYVTRDILSCCKVSAVITAICNFATACGINI